MVNRNDINDILVEHDKDIAALEAVFYVEVRKALPVLAAQNPDVNWDETLDLLQQAGTIIQNEGLAGFQERLLSNGAPDTRKIDAFGHLHNVLQTIRSYGPVITQRAYQHQTHESFESLRLAVQKMKELGYSLEDTVQFFDEIKISKSFTSHPTETLSPRGIALCNALVAAAETNDAGQRHNAVTQAVQDMILCKDFGAEKKSTVLDEIDASDSLARTHNRGCNMLERFIEDVIAEEYGRRPDDFSIDLAPRSWDYDADGKNNAEGWAMLTKMSGSTLHMVEEVLAYMSLAQDKYPDLDKAEDYQILSSQFETLMDNLRPVYNQAREITQKIADAETSEEREQYYISHYQKLHDLSKAFGEVYDFVDKEKRGFDFFKRSVERLGNLQAVVAAHNEEAALNIDEIRRTLRRNGLALEKGQTRHNDIIHTEIIDNLLRSPGFRERGILSAGDIIDMESRGTFSKLNPELQSMILNRITAFCAENGNRKEVLEDLFAANPLAFDQGGNGYPRQERSLLDRFLLRSLYPLKLDQGIISDCGDIGPTRQMFLADLFGMKNMRHMPLHEDRLTLSKQAQLLATFQRFGGGQGVERRRSLTLADPNWDWFLKGRDVHDLSIMRPCSDAERGGGWATRLEAFQSFRDNARRSYETRAPFEMMLGGGMSMGRFGGDVGIPRRVIEREFKKIAIERGQPFSHADKTERRIMRAALALLYTEQGRAKRYYTATPEQVADDFAGKIAEMVYGRLDLEGRVPDYEFILRPTPMSPHMLDLTERLRNRAIDEFMQLRFATLEGADPAASKSIITNRVARKITAPNIIGYMNNGARPGSKTGSKEMTEVRAIENNERDYLSQLHVGGYYSAGNFFKSLWQEMHKHTSPVSLSDIQNFMDDPEWDYNLFTKNLIDAGRADFSYALEKTGWKNATFDDLIAVGEQVRLVKNTGHSNYQLKFDSRGGTVTAEHAYIAKVFYDRALFISMTEAALTPESQNKPTLLSSLSEIIAGVRPVDNAPRADLGPLTQARYKASMATIQEHRGNMPGYGILYMLEDHVKAKVVAGANKEDVIEALGGEKFMRRAASSYRAGTVPHWPLWTGAVNYGKPNIPKRDAQPQSAVTVVATGPELRQPV